MHMLILGIETSTKTGSVAVLNEENLVAQYTLNIEITHSERLMATVDRMLEDSAIAITDIDGFAVSIGPGSFTGLRVGLSTVKGLAFVTKKPVAAVPTLRALAWNLSYAAYPVCPLLDARKNEVYAALYEFHDADLVQVMEEKAISLADLRKRITGKTLFTGEASRIYRKQIEETLGDRAWFAPVSACYPSAASVAEIGLGMIKNGETAEPDSLTPLYIRRPEAEVAWEKRKKSR